MPEPVLVPALVLLRGEFNRIAPNRDKKSDGWIGNEEHRERPSDHNPDANGYVHAIDIDSTGPWPIRFSSLMGFLLEQLRSGAETRIRYLIWDHYIYRSVYKFMKEAYVATPDPHTGHAHISAFHNSTAMRTTGWGIPTFVDHTINPPKVVRTMDPKNAQLIDDLLETGLGRSGVPTVGVALQSGYSKLQSLQVDVDGLVGDVAEIKTLLQQLVTQPKP